MWGEFRLWRARLERSAAGASGPGGWASPPTSRRCAEQRGQGSAESGTPDSKPRNSPPTCRRRMPCGRASGKPIPQPRASLPSSRSSSRSGTRADSSPAAARMERRPRAGIGSARAPTLRPVHEPRQEHQSDGGRRPRHQRDRHGIWPSRAFFVEDNGPTGTSDVFAIQTNDGPLLSGYLKRGDIVVRGG